MPYSREIEHADDAAYYRRRAAEEAQRANRAVTPAAKRAHRELASIFERKAAAFGGGELRLECASSMGSTPGSRGGAPMSSAGAEPHVTTSSPSLEVPRPG